MSEQDIHPNKFIELRSIYKYHIDSYNALYQLKTDKEEELKQIYKKIKTELIDSKKYMPKRIMEDILNIIPYNNRYSKSYLILAKFISDEYHVEEAYNAKRTSIFLFYKQYGIKLAKDDDFVKGDLKNLEIHTDDTIYKAIMYNDLKTFIIFTEGHGFDKDQKLESSLYPDSYHEYSLLELCCYHGAVDCFKLLRTKFNSEITKECLEFSFLGRNPEIMSECLKYQTPDELCMTYAIVSHNIDFVTFLMNEYDIEINLGVCADYNNLESFLVYFDQTNDIWHINKCFIFSLMFGISSLCEYFLSLGANVNIKFTKENIGLNSLGRFYKFGQTALHIATAYNSKEIVELLISYGANIDEKDNGGQTTLHIAVGYNCKEIAELLILHGANIGCPKVRLAQRSI
ncbi:hypothetical protein TVAG_197240 [Trichomonas vaginalis G3]|uniref:DUF3447 domain-containing protein n=1 Tax=Trichomonas vaginalis (strain ATCC PRA-98 / G3) TaxID=412133 RepID=A2EPJ4_TRIV3|nr:hypothetical protein TVAG_197240 [Trichomonas vaginalis G3]|eukprot:XP_001317646.1 hypothetical protein [Trichomonas vaginalis G3]